MVNAVNCETAHLFARVFPMIAFRGASSPHPLFISDILNVLKKAATFGGLRLPHPEMGGRVELLNLIGIILESILSKILRDQSLADHGLPLICHAGFEGKIARIQVVCFR